MMSLLSGLADTARQTEMVAETKASHARLGVDADSGRRVRVVIRRPDGDVAYSLRGSLALTLDRSADDWRDERVVITEPTASGRSM